MSSGRHDPGAEGDLRRMIIMLVIWVLMGVVGTLLRRDILEDARTQSGLFPIFAYIGPLVGGIILGPLALLAGLSQIRAGGTNEKRSRR